MSIAKCQQADAGCMSPSLHIIVGLQQEILKVFTTYFTAVQLLKCFFSGRTRQFCDSDRRGITVWVLQWGWVVMLVFGDLHGAQITLHAFCPATECPSVLLFTPCESMGILAASQPGAESGMRAKQKDNRVCEIQAQLL